MKCTSSQEQFILYVDGNKYIDMIPRLILYPVLKNLLYTEYAIHNMFKSNRDNNIGYL